MTTTIRHGFDPEHRDEVARLYWEAFGQKLGPVLRPEALALRFIDRVLRPDHAICAYDDAGTVLGVVGFKTPFGALVGGGFTDLWAVYGLPGASWRAGLLMLLERDVENDRLPLDGLFVRPEARGLGIGTALLDAVCVEAQQRGFREVRLDVVDTNPRARALYERAGFHAVGTISIGLVRHVFGFASATTMVRSIGPA